MNGWANEQECINCIVQLCRRHQHGQLYRPKVPAWYNSAAQHLKHPRPYVYNQISIDMNLNSLTQQILNQYLLNTWSGQGSVLRIRI